MAEPLLNLAPKTDVAQAAVRMDSISSTNQPVSDEPHPFAQLLAGQVEEGGEVAATSESPATGGKPVGQFLPAEGKELPDAARLLELAGLPLQTVETDTAQPVETASLPELTPEGSDVTSTELTDAQATASLTPATLVAETTATAEQAAALANPAAAQVQADAAMDASTGDETAAESGGRRVAAPAIMGAQSAPRPEVAADTDPNVPAPEQEPVRTLSVAVHQALQQRSEDKDAEPRFADLVRTVATAQAAAGEAGVRPEHALASGLQGTAAAASQQAAPALPTTAVAVPLRQSGWDQALGDQVQWLVGQKLQGAEIRLNPAHLGPMEVRIQVQHDQASISFSAQHGVVRDALEAAIPRLREMLGESGLQLANVHVSDQSFAEQRQQHQEQSFVNQRALDVGETLETEEVPVTLVTSLRSGGGGIDYFA